MTDVTKEVSEYIRDKGITISAISQRTGISDGVLRSSLCKKSKRKLRADEYLKICDFLGIDPLRFFVSSQEITQH